MKKFDDLRGDKAVKQKMSQPLLVKIQLVHSLWESLVAPVKRNMHITHDLVILLSCMHLEGQYEQLDCNLSFSIRDREILTLTQITCNTNTRNI